MAITAAFNLEIAQLDAINAFLNSDIDEEVYVGYPEGYNRPKRPCNYAERYMDYDSHRYCGIRISQRP